MSKRISKILSILLSASLAAASVPVIPLAAYADDGTTSSTSESAYNSTDGAVDFGNAAGDINPEDIENVSVLKGPAATALYG